MADRVSTRTGGRLLLILLCALLLIGSAALYCLDIRRDRRHGFYRCEDGRILEEAAVPDPDVLRATASGMQKLAREFPGVQQSLMLIPSSAAVESRYLPNGVLLRDQSADFEQIRAQLPAGVSWIDLLSILRSHESEKLYYASDTWLTGWGSRYAAFAAMESMGAEAPQGDEVCYLLSDKFSGRLVRDELPIDRLLKKKKERLEIYVPREEAACLCTDVSTGRKKGSMYDASAVRGSNPYDVFFGGERPLTVIDTTAVGSGVLLVVGDRTADSIVPLLASSFERIILLHTAKSGDSVESVVRKYQPGRVLYIYGANTYMTDRALAAALGFSAALKT